MRNLKMATGILVVAFCFGLMLSAFAPGAAVAKEEGPNWPPNHCPGPACQTQCYCTQQPNGCVFGSGDILWQEFDFYGLYCMLPCRSTFACVVECPCGTPGGS